MVFACSHPEKLASHELASEAMHIHVSEMKRTEVCLASFRHFQNVATAKSYDMDEPIRASASSLV